MNKKETVIETARELFSKYGYRKVSMDEIAKQSNVTKKTIYTYFKDKNDLIKYFLYEEINKMKDITDKIDKKDIPFEDKLYELITLQMNYRNSSKLLKAFLKEADQGIGIADECTKIINSTIQKELKNKLEEAKKEGYIKDIDTDIASFLIYKIYVALMVEIDKPINEKIATETIMNILKAWLLK